MAPPVSISWIREDDLLLKNAVEAGASLEALAKGAVQFTRKYTLKELRERWYSLLYDPDVSVPASARMFELEISGINPAPKFNKLENSNLGNREVPQKRKIESIRRKYYTMRKKIRSEYFRNTNLRFFEPIPQKFSGHGGDFHKHVMLDSDPLDQTCILGDNTIESLSLQEEDLDILRHAFPNINVASSAPNASQTGCLTSYENSNRSGIMEGYGFAKNGAHALTVGGNDICDVNMKNSKSPLALRTSSVDDGNLHISSVGFEGTQQCGAPTSDVFPPFQRVDFASNNLHHWRTMEDSSAPSIPVSMSVQDTVAEDVIQNDVEGKESSSGMCTGEFGDPDSLLNLANEDETLLEDADVKSGDTESCAKNIDSVFQVSNKDVLENDGSEVTPNTAIISESSSMLSCGNIDSVFQVSNKDVQENYGSEVTPNTAIISESSSMLSCGANSVVLNANAVPVHGVHEQNLRSVVDAPSKSTSNFDIVEYSDGKICCVLNTEDTEIPCNDDIFLLIHPSSSFGSSLTQPTTSVSMNVSAASYTNKIEQSVNCPTKSMDCKKGVECSQKVGTYGLPTALNSVQPVFSHVAKTEIFDSRPEKQPAFVGKAIKDSSKGRSLDAIPRLSTDRLPYKQVARVDVKVGDNPATTTTLMKPREAGCGGVSVPEPALDSASDYVESDLDDDVPSFSDVEAMILEMDLDPCDQDSHIIRRGNLSVPSNQYDGTKSTIIRLEQAARSCLQRAMTSRGSLAILYGRHSRHHIRKPEVLLGRSTEDIDVDINLSREGRANKISRRQAIIKMEADGSFVLKNLGKSSVSVNGMAVATGQLVNLSSSCLIEIKGMSFVFEINQAYVRKHLGDICLKNKGKTVKSDCLAENIK